MLARTTTISRKTAQAAQVTSAFGSDSAYREPAWWLTGRRFVSNSSVHKLILERLKLLGLAANRALTGRIRTHKLHALERVLPSSLPRWHQQEI